MNSKKKNIQVISDSLLCAACGACAAACNHDAIGFSWNPIGRKYAIVNEEKCTSCGICQLACPSIDTLNLNQRYNDKYIGDIRKVFIGRTNNISMFKNAQSGGICTAIISFLFESKEIDGAIMCRMNSSDNPSIEGVLIENKDDLVLCQKSCYTPVDVLSILKQTKGKSSLAIVGLPCHIQGATLLKEQLKRFSNIKYKIGLICDRTLCRGIQDVFLSYTSDKNVKIHWRKKDFIHKGKYYSYKNAPIVVVNHLNQIVKKGIMPNYFRFALKDMFTSPRCRVCYDKLNTHADIVCGDPWGMEDVDWDHGDSVVITRTPIGEKIIEKMMEKDVVSLKEQKNPNVFILGQKMDKKAPQTACYSEAIKIIPQSTNSYLLHQNSDSPFSEHDLNKAKTEILTFIDNEKKDKKELIQIGRNKIFQAKNKRSFTYLFLKKIINKSKKIFKS